MSDERRRDYFVIEAVGDSPRIQGKYDVFLTRWPDTKSFIEDYLDAIESDVKVTLSFTHHSWTRAEMEAYCEANDIDSEPLG